MVSNMREWKHEIVAFLGNTIFALVIHLLNLSRRDMKVLGHSRKYTSDDSANFRRTSAFTI